MWTCTIPDDIDGFMGNIYISKIFILNPGMPNTLRSNNPIKSYSNLHISHWLVGVWAPYSICHVYVLHQTRIALKTLPFILQSLILNRYLPKTFRSDHLIKRFDSLHISHRNRFGVLSPKTSFFILMLSPRTHIVLLNLAIKLALWLKVFASNWNNWSQIFEYNPTFLWKWRHWWVFTGNIYISITCSSLFRI